MNAEKACMEGLTVQGTALIDVVPDEMYLRPQVFDFLGGTGLNRPSFNESDKKSPF